MAWTSVYGFVVIVLFTIIVNMVTLNVLLCIECLFMTTIETFSNWFTTENKFSRETFTKT